MSDSPHLGIGYLAPSQAQKHVTVNEAFRRLDALVQLGVDDRTRTAPPSSPAEGQRHIVATGATGAWAGQDDRIAAYLDGRWIFVEPKNGWLAYVADEGELLVHLSAGWVSALGSLSSLDAITKLGVNATADLVNRLAVSSQAVLFNHAGAGVQVKLNKASASDVASFLFQRGFSGRAEFGLVGSDGFSLKVSADGSSWTTALTVDPATGSVEQPATQQVKVDKFTASGTWTKPSWASRVRVLLISGGSGGGAGGLRAASTAVSGGGGGAPGGVTEFEFSAADLTATVAVTVGAGGAGGAAQSTASADGAAGVAGGVTSFGAYCVARSGAASGGGGASAGTAGVLRGYVCNPPTADVSAGAGATAAGAAGAAGPARISGGGGGGGGVTAANAFAAGGAAGNSSFVIASAASAAGGASDGAAGTAGSVFAQIATFLSSGGSGGGGAGGQAVNGGAGGDGAAPGGGGGGGGASRNGLQSGKGGNGARGEAWIVSTR